MKKVLYILCFIESLTLLSCAASLADYGYSSGDTHVSMGGDIHPGASSIFQYSGFQAGTNPLRIGVSALQPVNRGGDNLRTHPIYLGGFAAKDQMLSMGTAQVYPPAIVPYNSNKTLARVATVVRNDSASQKPAIDVYVFDTFRDSIVFYGGKEQIAPQLRNDKKGEWLFEGEVALAPTQKDKAKQRERYMTYKLTYSPDQKRPRVQSYKVKTRKVAK